MAEPFDRIASDTELLSERVRELELRVSALENMPAKTIPSPFVSASVGAPKSSAPETSRGFPGPSVSTGTLPVFGKAVLGISGAYLLRAVAESGALPQWPILIVAIGYACLWLVWAVRAHNTNTLASVTYAITATTILCPLLWESTVRFQILWPPFTAAVLVAFPVLAWAMTWRNNLRAISWVTTLASVATAVALIIATRGLLPFTTGLLALALVAEAIDFRHSLSIRVVPAVAADFALWLLIYVMTLPEGAPSEYRPVGSIAITGLCLAMLAIYGGSIGTRSLGLRHRLTIFEVLQVAVAFVLATFGIMRSSPGSGVALGVFFLLLAILCYWGTLSRFAADEHILDRRVYASFAVALLLTGSLVAFPSSLRAFVLCVAALTASFLYMRTGKLSLGLHVSLYLTTAAIFSGLLRLVGDALAGQVPPAPDSVVWVVAVSAVLCYGIGSHGSTEQRKQRLLWIVPSALVAGVAVTLAVIVSAKLGSSIGTLNASRLSVVQTVATCSAALILGFAGSRLKRAELLWVAYAAIAFGTLKLVFEDLRFGSAASLVASLLFYGLILILLPRLTRLGRDGL